MEIEVLEENIKYSAPVINCAICKKTDCKEWTFGLMKNTFYCPECWKIIPNVDTAIDTRFKELEKRVEDLIKGAVEKNKKLRKLEEEQEKIVEKTDNINKFIEELIKKSEELEEKNI